MKITVNGVSNTESDENTPSIFTKQNNSSQILAQIFQKNYSVERKSKNRMIFKDEQSTIERDSFSRGSPKTNKLGFNPLKVRSQAQVNKTQHEKSNLI